jgi:hypothetical protein
VRAERLFREVLAKARLRQELVFDDAAHRRGLVGECPLVEIAEDGVVRAGQQVERDLVPSLRDARVVELAADEAQQRRLDLGVRDLRAAGYEPDDGLGDLLRYQPLARAEDCLESLLSRHGREAQAILRDARHLRLQALERREVVLAQGDQHAVVAACEVEALGRRVVQLQLRLELPWRAVLDEVREVLDEARGPRASGLVGLGEREDLLELVEDQERDERVTCLVEEDVVAVVQELPERLAGRGDASLRPLPGVARGLQDRLLDLLARLRRVRGVGDADVDRAIAVAAQARNQPGAQDRRLAEP